MTDLPSGVHLLDPQTAKTAYEAIAFDMQVPLAAQPELCAAVMGFLEAAYKRGFCLAQVIGHNHSEYVRMRWGLRKPVSFSLDPGIKKAKEGGGVTSEGTPAQPTGGQTSAPQDSNGGRLANDVADGGTARPDPAQPGQG